MSDTGTTASGSTQTGTINDDHGNALISSSTAADGSAGFLGAVSRWTQSGIYNGDFLLTPLSADGAITDHNTLPGFTFAHLTGSSLEFTSEADTTSASGRRIRISTLSNATALDESYVEQIIRINGSRGRSFAYTPVATFLTGPTTSTGSMNVRSQYLKADGVTTTGTAGTSTAISTATVGANTVVDIIGTANGGLQPPADAYFLRIRVGFQNVAGVQETLYITEIRRLVGDGYVLIAETSTPDTYSPGKISQTAGVLTVAPATSSHPSTAALTLSPATSTTTLTGKFVAVPGTGTVITAATDTIVVTGLIVGIRTSGANFTLTSAPTIADGTDGQLVIINVLSTGGTITISDTGTLANSNLRLSTATYAMSNRDSIILMYSSNHGDWVEISRSNVI